MVSSGAGCRHSLDTMWLWCRPAAIALIEPLAWEPPYTMGAALKKTKDTHTKKNKNKQELENIRRSQEKVENSFAKTQAELKALKSRMNNAKE